MLKPGMKIKDNDVRMGTRILTIEEILPNGVVAKSPVGRLVTILRRRIFTDGKPRKSGFDLIYTND
jgi:hypothetical protein